MDHPRYLCNGWQGDHFLMVVLRTRLRDGRRVRVTLKKRKRQATGRSGVRVPRNYQSLAVNTSVVPNKYRAKLKYVMYGSMDPAAGLYSEQVFNAVSLNDPDFTGAGHQPRGYDQIMAMYSVYQVMAASIIVEVVPGPTSTGQPGVIALSCSQDTSSYNSSGFDFFEQPAVVYKMMPNDASVTKQLKLAVVPWKVIGIDKEDNALKAAANANPTQVLYLRFSYGATDLSAENPGPISYMVTIIYDAEFTARKIPGVS